LTQPLSFPAEGGNAIEIAADSVTLDLGGIGITGTAGAGSSAVGIYAFERKQVVIRNGYVMGFLYGVFARGGVSNLVESLRVTDNWYLGIWLQGAGSVVRNNQVVRTGLTSLPLYTIPIAIRVAGSGIQVTDNVISTVYAKAESVGIHVESGTGAHLERNSISNPEIWANTWAVWVNAEQVLIKDNHIARWLNGLAFPTGSGGVYRDNTTVDVPNPIVGTAIDAGGNW
jgi:parallel beta-helix repeat protein